MSPVSVLEDCFSEVLAKGRFLPLKNFCRSEQEFVSD